MELSLEGVQCRVIEIVPRSAPVTQGRRPYYHHCHPNYELYYVTAGTCDVSGSRQTLRVGAGELLLIPPETYHYVSATSEDVSRMQMAFSIRLPEEGDTAPGRQFCGAFPRQGLTLLEVSPALAAALEQVRTLAADPADGYARREKLRATCALLLLELFEQLTQRQSAAAQTAAVPPAPEDYLIDTFLGRNFNSNQANALLAQQLSVSPRSLHRIIKKSYGVNYREKLKEIRMEIAGDMLCRTDKPIAEIAELLGYSSSAHFSTFIKNVTGMTPTQIRREAAKRNPR